MNKYYATQNREKWSEEEKLNYNLRYHLIARAWPHHNTAPGHHLLLGIIRFSYDPPLY